jgi:hypothetical protein
MTSVSLSTWCSFCTIPSAAKAAEVSANCLFSLATLEVGRNPATTNFALTEQEQAEVWRWAIISPAGAILDDGHEPTRALAKHVAEETLRPVAA